MCASVARFSGSDERACIVPSCPRLSRASTRSGAVAFQDVDGRDNPRIKSGDGHDGRSVLPFISPRQPHSAPISAAVCADHSREARRIPPSAHNPRARNGEKWRCRRHGGAAKDYSQARGRGRRVRRCAIISRNCKGRAAARLGCRPANADRRTSHRPRGSAAKAKVRGGARQWDGKIRPTTENVPPATRHRPRPCAGSPIRRRRRKENSSRRQRTGRAEEHRE